MGFLRKKNPRKIDWTVMYRKINKKNVTEGYQKTCQEGQKGAESLHWCRFGDYPTQKGTKKHHQNRSQRCCRQGNQGEKGKEEGQQEPRWWQATKDARPKATWKEGKISRTFGSCRLLSSVEK